jgi:hypothetical protein
VLRVTSLGSINFDVTLLEQVRPRMVLLVSTSDIAEAQARGEDFMLVSVPVDVERQLSAVPAEVQMTERGGSEHHSGYKGHTADDQHEGEHGAATPATTSHPTRSDQYAAVATVEAEAATQV